MGIVGFALRYRHTFYVLALMMLFLGGSAILTTPKDIFPNINIPVVSVIWQYTGLTPEEMEQRVATYSEYAYSSNVSDIRNMESQSLEGITVEKMLPVFGFDDAPHGHAQVLMENVRVPASNILLGEGRGFEIAQGRLGPGRIHHCMRTIGKAEEALEKMVKRLSSRTAFGKKIIEFSIWEQRIAEARTDIEMNRLLCLKAADMMDKVGNKTAQLEIAMIKVAAPNMALKIIDHAIQAFGAAGVSDDAGLARDYASMRTMRLADGPDEVHNRAIARLELRKYSNAPAK